MILEAYQSFRLILVKALLLGFISCPLYGQKSNDVLVDSFQVLIDHEGVVDFLKISNQEEWKYFLSRYNNQNRIINLRGLELSGIYGSEFGMSIMLRFVEFLKKHAQQLEYFSWEGTIETDFMSKENQALLGFLQGCNIQRIRWEGKSSENVKQYKSIWNDFHAVFSRVPSVSLRGTPISDFQDSIAQKVWSNVEELDISDTDIKSYFIHDITTTSFPKLHTLLTEGMSFSNKHQFEGDFPHLITWSLVGLKTDSDKDLKNFVQIYYPILSKCENVYFSLAVRKNNIFESDIDETQPFIVSTKDTTQWHNVRASYNPLDDLQPLVSTGYFSRSYRRLFIPKKPNTGRNGWVLTDSTDINLFLSHPEFDSVSQVAIGGKLGIKDVEGLIIKASNISLIYLININFEIAALRGIQEQFKEKRIIAISISGVNENDDVNPALDQSSKEWRDKWMRDQMRKNMNPKIPNVPKIHR